jgi:hypothetical protein
LEDDDVLGDLTSVPAREIATMLRIVTMAVVVVGLVALAFAAEEPRGAANPAQGEKTQTHRVFELRTYYTNEGKLDDLHKRFRNHTCQLLRKHGAELIGFWTPQDEKDGKGGKLIYLLAFPSRDAAKQAWKEFSDDPEWKSVYAESHKNGVLVKKVESIYLDPTDYSELK